VKFSLTACTNLPVFLHGLCNFVHVLRTLPQGGLGPGRSRLLCSFEASIHLILGTGLHLILCLVVLCTGTAGQMSRAQSKLIGRESHPPLNSEKLQSRIGGCVNSRQLYNPNLPPSKAVTSFKYLRFVGTDSANVRYDD
jgi:hypothetical protein